MDGKEQGIYNSLHTDKHRERSMYGTGQTRTMPIFCFLFIIVYIQILGICICGLVSPLQGGGIDMD